MHPITGEEFDYEHVCASCAHYAERTRRKVPIQTCALAPELDGQKIEGQHRPSMLACAKWVKHPTRKPKPKKKSGRSKQRTLDPWNDETPDQ